MKRTTIAEYLMDTFKNINIIFTAAVMRGKKSEAHPCIGNTEYPFFIFKDGSVLEFKICDELYPVWCVKYENLEMYTTFGMAS